MKMLSEDVLSRVLETLPDWTLQGDALVWQRRFPDFAAAFTFLTRVALLAEKRDHHPDIRLEYDRLELRLKSHDVDRITQRDLDMAAAVSELGTF